MVSPFAIILLSRWWALRAVRYWAQDFVGFAMTVDDFRRIALSFAGAEESSHMGQPDFRVGGRIFATLASTKQGYGNLQLSLEQQAAFVEELPEVFLPVHGGWGRMGMTHIRLAAATEEVLTGALHTAWKLRVEKNAKTRPKLDAPSKAKPAARASKASAEPSGRKPAQPRGKTKTAPSRISSTVSPGECPAPFPASEPACYPRHRRSDP
jgi:hypothetical protein